MQINLLELGYSLLKELNIHRTFVLQDHYEIRYEFENKAIISYGRTEEETVQNFYELYQQLSKFN